MNRKHLSAFFFVLSSLIGGPGFAATINVGTHYLVEDMPGQPIEIVVASEHEQITGMRLIAEIAFGGPVFDPSIWPTDDEWLSTPIDVLTNTIWTDPLVVFSTYPELQDNGRTVKIKVLRSTPGPADGLLATLYVDTGADEQEGPWNLSLEGTTLLDETGLPIATTVIPGEIVIATEPSTIVMLLSAVVVSLVVAAVRLLRARTNRDVPVSRET